MSTSTHGALQHAIAARRTFAIISHPDAGKTTLTEKLLLYGGAVQEAGQVRARKNRRAATSDWMAMEQERGISVTSTVLQFPYKAHVINLLDTPGHQDFSEDTYRTLTAADSAVMVIDAAKGIEAQTRKLFEVTSERGIPILTFVNKMDRPAQPPLALLDEIEEVLGLTPVPMNWPIGDGEAFRGVYDRETRQLHLFERTAHGAKQAEVEVVSLDDPRLAQEIGEQPLAKLREEIELVDHVLPRFEEEAFRAAQITPVYFGSALTNFGVQLFFDSFVALAPAPGPRRTADGGALIPPTDEDFSGFIFKIQSNMNPRHRDSIAFLRICSGRFTRSMVVQQPREGRELRLSNSHSFFAQARETVDEAYPGDVIGLISTGHFAIGDTLCTGSPIEFEPMPRFQPEYFARLSNIDTRRYKQFWKGLSQLQKEGAIQLLFEPQMMGREPILAAVGELQFDVVSHRMENEYNTETRMERLPYSVARWVDGPAEAVDALPWNRNALRLENGEGKTVALFRNEWMLNSFVEAHGGDTVRFRSIRDLELIPVA
ncbi:MAG: peptide chain release factor 3 [Ardenticatenales bacterium]|nr:peptide chain release factor 3 [Ardenticatenales bacterium]